MGVIAPPPPPSGGGDIVPPVYYWSLHYSPLLHQIHPGLPSLSVLFGGGRYYMLCYGDNCCCLIVVCSKIIQSKEAKRGVILEYIKDYCVYRLQLTPDKEHIPTPNTLLNSCWNTLDDARYTHTKIYTSNWEYQLYQSPDRETGWKFSTRLPISALVWLSVLTLRQLAESLVSDIYCKISKITKIRWMWHKKYTFNSFITLQNGLNIILIENRWAAFEMVIAAIELNCGNLPQNHSEVMCI